MWCPIGAALLRDALAAEGMEVPRPGKDVLVYARLKKSGGYVERDYFEWKRRYLRGAVNSEYVRNHQRDVLLNLDFAHLASRWMCGRLRRQVRALKVGVLL